MDISLVGQQNRAQMEPADQKQIQKVIAGLNKLLLQNVKIGDLLTGEIIDSLQKEIKLLLPDGTIIEAQLEKALELYIGQEVNLEVKEIIGKQVRVEMVIENNDQQQETKTDMTNILKQLDVAITEDSQKAVELLMQRMMPITKENIKQIEFGLKTSQLPIDSILAMLENEIPITPNTLTQVQAYENGEIKLQGQLEKMIENILGSNDRGFLEQIHTILSSSKESKEISDQIPEEMPEQTEVLDSPETLKESQILRGPETLEEGESLGKLEVLDRLRQTSTLLASEEGGIKPHLSQDIDIIKKEIADLFKELLFIDPNGLKDKTETKLQKTKELYKEIYKLTDTLEKMEDLGSEKSGTESQRATLYSDIKSNIEFLTVANKYDTIIHIPLVIQNQYKHGELYIFNKKKTGKKSYHEASMLISLETASLGTVEVYIKKYNKQISAQFKTDDEIIENIIKDKIELLKISLKDKGYDLTTIAYIASGQPFQVEEETMANMKPGRYRFDTKA